MPASGLGSQIRPNISAFSNNTGLESFSAAKYLLQNEDDRATVTEDDRIPTPDIKSYLKLTDPDDKFPTLSRRDDSGLVGFECYVFPPPWFLLSYRHTHTHSISLLSFYLVYLLFVPQPACDFC